MINSRFAGQAISLTLIPQLLILLFSFIPITAAATNNIDESDDKTLSPYFRVISDTDGQEQLPLKKTSALVNIAGTIADVQVTQLYANTSKQPLEAIYVFPGSTRSAVYGMRMTIGERVVTAKIMERKAATQKYEQAKAEGKSASLLEQHRPNVFQMNVANIMPGDEIKVELFYTENLLPDEGIYEFIYPTVVGPRYATNTTDSPSPNNWTANPYLGKGEPPTNLFDITVNLATGIPIRNVSCPTHEVKSSFTAENRATITLADKETPNGNRDYVLRYRLRDQKVQAGLLLYQGEKENFFLLTMEPPERVTVEQIPPREYIYVVDVSGSMNGFPLDTTKDLIRDLVSGLRPTDTFNVLLFASSSNIMAKRSLAATTDNINRALNFIDRQGGGGGTELLPAMKRALQLPAAEDVSRTIIVITDGYVNVETATFKFIRDNLNNANLFAFGIGSSVNRFLIEGMARAGQGEPFVILTSEEASFQADKFRKYINTPVLTDIHIDYGEFDAYQVEPPAIPDLLAQRPITLYGKWKGKAEGNITVRGNHGGEIFEKQISLSSSPPDASNKGLRYLWARNRIQTQGDYYALDHDMDRKAEITNLGLTYNLLTQFTSFIAVDEQVRNSSGKSKSVKQPLLLPQGVSNYAVGSNVPTVPEPETYMMMLLLLAGLFTWLIYTGRLKAFFESHK
ncbi:MAG: VIT and VWA domain-containing protein [Desulfobulbaceae bacterium]|nr:VIT and VWA domain-containing protein [Desulfobulbaceae bacterium]